MEDERDYLRKSAGEELIYNKRICIRATYFVLFIAKTSNIILYFWCLFSTNFSMYNTEILLSFISTIIFQCTGSSKHGNENNQDHSVDICNVATRVRNRRPIKTQLLSITMVPHRKAVHQNWFPVPL